MNTQIQRYDSDTGEILEIYDQGTDKWMRIACNAMGLCRLIGSARIKEIDMTQHMVLIKPFDKKCKSKIHEEMVKVLDAILRKEY